MHTVRTASDPREYPALDPAPAQDGPRSVPGRWLIFPLAVAYATLGFATACSVDTSNLRARTLADAGAKAPDANEIDGAETDKRDTFATLDRPLDLPLDFPLDRPLDQHPANADTAIEAGDDGVISGPDVASRTETGDAAEAGVDASADLIRDNRDTFEPQGTGGAGGAGTGGMGGSGGVLATGGTGTGGITGSGGAIATGGTSVTLPPGLVAWWKMDEEAGSGTAMDASGNGNDATLSGLSTTLAWTTGHSGGALKCDGSGGALINDSASLDGITTGVTLAAWVNRLSATTGYTAILSRAIGTTNANHYFLGLSGNYPGFYGSAYGVFATTALPLGTWTHVAVTSDGNTVRIYLNGSQVTNRASNGVFRADTSKLVICGNQNDATGAIQERWNGLVDDLQLYNRALTATEIAGLAN